MAIDWDVMDDLPLEVDAEPGFKFKGRGRDLTAEIQDCEAIAESDKALLIKTVGVSQERWVPKSQIMGTSEVLHRGQRGSLHVTQWFARQWNEEDANAPRKEDEEKHVIADVICLQETAKGLLIKLPDGEEEWFPKRGVMDDSPVQGDSDQGELWVKPWLAKKRGM